MRTKWAVIILCVILATSLVMLGCSSQKAEKYPNKPITMYVIYGAGGVSDLSARALAKAAEKVLSVPVVVVNKPGGNGATGLTELKNASKDGQTIGMITFSAAAIVPNQAKVSYSPSDFEGIMGYGEYNYGVAVKANSPYKTISDLSNAAKQKPGGLSFASAGYPQPFAADKIAAKDNCKFRLVTLKSGVEAATAVVGEHVDFVIATVTDLLQFQKSGDIRIIASGGEKRIAQAPDAPTLKELGYDIAIVSWLGLGAPTGIPADRLQILRAAFKTAAEDPEYLAVMKKINLDTSNRSGAEFQKLIIEGHSQIGEYFKKIGK
ncbi:MAG: tripartite tricarboxylate transporter substrate binding protein [Negativicutes bacterium]